MKKYIWQIIVLVVAIVIAILAYFYGKSQAKTDIQYKEYKLTQKRIDSIKSTITPVEKEVIKYVEKREQLKKKEKTIVYPIEDCKEIVDNLKEQLENCDQVVKLKDTIIYKERLVIHYKDKLIDKMVFPKPKRFGVGFQVGATTDLKEVRPYIGVGVSYNLIRF